MFGTIELPRPSGQYSVGCFDYEWLPTATGDRGRDTSDHSRPIHPILVRFYYPSLLQNLHDIDPPEWRNRTSWIPSPHYVKGITYILKWRLNK